MGMVGFRDGSPREIFFEREGDESNNEQNKEFSEPISNCLRTNYSTGFSNETYVAEEGLKIRRLTPIECERLMGLPDGWTEYGADFVAGEDGKLYLKRKDISDSQRYKMCGNGVVINVVEDIIKQLIIKESAVESAN